MLNKVAAILIALIAVIIFIAIMLNLTSITKGGLFNFLDETNKTKLVGISGDIPFFNQILIDYQECKISPSTNCFCKLTMPETSEKYVLEIDNDLQAKKTIFRLYSNAQMETCGIISPTYAQDKINTTEEYIENDLIYFENVLTNPSVLSSGEEYGTFSISDFTPVNKLYLYGNTLCSIKDVIGSDDIELDQGFLYKFDNEKTAVSSGEFNLQRCNTVKGSFEALSILNDFNFKSKNCEKGEVCSFPITIPENFEILIENNELKLKHNNNLLRSISLEDQNPCLFTHFSLDKRQELEITNLLFNDYLQIDIYKYENKTCYLPYDRQLITEKQVAVARESVNSPLIPVE